MKYKPFLALILVGCDVKPVAQSDTTPFSVAKIQLGMDTKKAKSIRSLGYCQQKTEDVVECFSTPENDRVRLLGATIEDQQFSI